MEMLQVLESIRAEEASVQRLFGKEGTPVRGKNNPRYMAKLNEAAKLIADVYTGRKPMHYLQEAMTTSDFPYLFGDVLDRQILAAYREYPTSWQNYIKRGRVRDFRDVKRFSVYGGDTRLVDVVGNEGEYPYESINENSPYTYAVKKYGRKMKFAWETMVNDDLDALKDAPERFGRGARRSEEWFATNLFVDANGPHASFYTVGNKNIVTGNPALSLAALQTALEILFAQTDESGEPIVIEAVELVYPPVLEVTVQNILNAITIEATEKGGTSARKLTVQNWMKTTFRPNKNAYIPSVASSANGNTSWFLFANPDNGRPAAEMGFLIGHEEPEVFMKAPNQIPVGGGSGDAMNGDFESDAIEYKVRHVLGGTRMDPKMTVGSNGSGG
jgi:hypothetical protein